MLVTNYALFEAVTDLGDGILDEVAQGAGSAFVESVASVIASLLNSLATFRLVIDVICDYVCHRVFYNCMQQLSLCLLTCVHKDALRIIVVLGILKGDNHQSISG